MPDKEYSALFTKYRDSTVVQSAEAYAFWTVAALMADLNGAQRAQVERDFQSVGALLVNHLSSRLATMLFPTGVPFFQIAMRSAELKRIAQEQQLTTEQVDTGLAVLALEASSKAHEGGSYANIVLLLKHLITTGNALIFVEEDSPYLTIYGIGSYVTRRDNRGRLIDLILKESTSLDGLEPALQRRVRARFPGLAEDSALSMHTRVHLKYRKNKRGYEITQQIAGMDVGTPSWYPAHLCPYIAATWSLIPGEHYGRGMVEDYSGDFAKLSSISEAETLYICEMLRVIHLVGNGGDVDSFEQASCGGYVRGNPDMVKAHEAGDARKAEQTAATLAGTVQRLSRAFMYNTGTVRDSERTTLGEIRMQAQEAEEALGGSYSMVAQVVQTPLARLFLSLTDDDMRMAVMTQELVPDITVGIGALGRTRDVQNLLAAAQEINAVATLPQIDERFDIRRMTDRVLAGHSINPATIFHSPAEQKRMEEAAIQQQQGQQQLLAAATASDQIEALGALQNQ